MTTDHLAVWDNSHDWVIAENPVEATRLMHVALAVEAGHRATRAESPMTESDMRDTPAWGWVRLDDEQLLALPCDPLGRVCERGYGAIVEQTCAEWVRVKGKGYLGAPSGSFGARRS